MRLSSCGTFTITADAGCARIALCDSALPAAAVTMPTTPWACSWAGSDGGDVVADQDLAGQALHHRRAFRLQERVDAADDMVQVVHAALQVGIVHAIEDLARRSRCRRNA